ncbi:MAG: cation-translocating P-type ATPase [Halobacteriota archaeon]
MSDGEREGERHWHTLDVERTVEELDADPPGLAGDEAARRLEEDGPNALPKREPASWWRILRRQFDDPLIFVLGLAAIVSLGIGEVVDALFIGLVLGVNAAIGSVQEWQAERSSQALQGLIRTRATVIRDGETQDVDGEAVVPGDVVLLEAGYRVPADVRLLATRNLEVDESALTGESAGVLKDEHWVGDERAPIGDRRNMAFAGTVVNRGRGRGVVVATGTDTEVGQLAEDVTTVEGGVPPLVARMERFTRLVGVVVLIVAAITALLGIGVGHFDAVEMFLFAVALAVSAIPEGLPVGITVALGVASRRMARVGVIVRRLVAVEGLGSCTMIASDKTGTLTKNELTVEQVRLPGGRTVSVTGTGYVPTGTVLQDGHPPDPDVADDLSRIARAAVLCNEGALYQHDEAWTWRGDPTDVALLVFGEKLGWSRRSALDCYPQVGDLPFEPEFRFGATYHENEGETRVFVKGAPERVLAMCDLGGADTASRVRLREQVTEMAQRGYRVLALAEGTVASATETAPDTEPNDLTLLGFLGLIDPLRPGVAEAVRAAEHAGIAVTMVTGDHPETALAIARDLDLADSAEAVMTGAEFVDLPPDAVGDVLETTRVFARVSPDQKLQIVEAARGVGHFVAVTGDGVNDAPALRQANIGIAMGKTGTDVARDAAELVISDDDFASIVAGIAAGRVAYDNIRKIVYLLVSTGAGEVILVLASLAAGMPLPLLPVQILWLNLVTNGIQDVALAFEPEEGDVLDRPPRDPEERIFDRLMVERVGVAALVIGGLGFATFGWLLGQGLPEDAARNHLLLLIVLFEMVNIGNARSETVSVFALSPLRSPVLVAGTSLAMGVHLAAMYHPVGQAVLGTAPVGFDQWVVLGGLSLVMLVAMEIHGWTWRKRFPRDATGATGRDTTIDRADDDSTDRTDRNRRRPDSDRND